jgi:ASPIC/UnbV protein/VCBS repeat protein/putative metal-binding protein
MRYPRTMRSLSWLGATAAIMWVLGACVEEEVLPVEPATVGSGGVGGGGGQGGEGGVPVAPGPEFDRFCQGRPWDAATEQVTVGELTGDYLGVLMTAPPIGSLSTMKVIPEDPFWAKTIRVAFGKGQGQARIRLMTTFGRSYPGGWPDIDSEGVNLVAPIDIEVGPDPDPEKWIEIDIAAAGVFLLPTQHYAIVFEQLSAEPELAVESLAGEPASRALLHVPGDDLPYGLGDASFRMELVGETFCAWTADERWFGVRDVPFSGAQSGATIVDVDGDRHDDVLVREPLPALYFGDGTGAFTDAGLEIFPDAPAASLFVFADVDNDGDRDAFAGHYVTPNGDGDAYTLAEGDCNDTDPAVHPNVAEQSNGYDDDCDGVADDGMDASDADMDGIAIVAGDCDDTRNDVYPGAPELLDGRDNDCDASTDEDFVDRILLNDGQAVFTPVPVAGVEGLDPTTAAGFGDADGDGDLDLFWGNWLEHYPDFPAVPARYATGNGDGTFVDATVAAGLVDDPARPCYGVTWNDYDDDGSQDIFVSNYQLSDNNLWRNQGDGTFVDVAPQVGVDHDDVPSGLPQYPGGHSYGASFGDLDLDGDFDLFVPNLAHPRTMPWSDTSKLYLSSGAPDYLFEDHREELGIIYNEGDINSALGDYDNDMDLDLFVGSAYPTHYSILYRNDGPDGFVDVTYETGTASHLSGSVAFADVDEDGDLDVFISQAFGPLYLRLFENRVGQDRHWVELELRGTTTNRDALGARVTLDAGGVVQLREVLGGTALGLQHSHLVHFGLADTTTIDSVTVRWIGGATETFTGVGADGRWLLVEGTGQAAPF